jgi:hypothetical protein
VKSQKLSERCWTKTKYFIVWEVFTAGDSYDT